MVNAAIDGYIQPCWQGACLSDGCLHTLTAGGMGGGGGGLGRFSGGGDTARGGRGGDNVIGGLLGIIGEGGADGGALGGLGGGEALGVGVAVAAVVFGAAHTKYTLVGN